MDLKHELEQELQRCRFIQLSALHRLVTEKSVRAFFDSNRLELSTAELQKITTKGSKLFAILVLLGRGGAIKECLRQDFFLDKSFPVLDKTDIPNIRGLDKQDLYNRQWQIPIILPRSPHLNLPNEFIPPILPNRDREIRNGSFGLVFKEEVASGHLEHYSSSGFVALKVIKKDDKNDWEIMMREVETLRARRHEHVVPLLSSWTRQFIESEVQAASLNLLFPYSSMTLDKWLNLTEPPQLWKGLKANELKDYIYHSMKCLCDAVTYLHKDIDGMISSHHDLKPENILLFGKVWKIADFGRTHLKRIAEGSDTEGKSGLGTFTYNPPEYYNSSGEQAHVRHGRAFDIWALGCIFVEFTTIAVYGWSSQKLRQFEEKRKENKSHSVKHFAHRVNKPDDSYHNNMNIVEYWMRQLRDSDGSSRLISVLGTIATMLSTDPNNRPLSWEVYLDLDELLGPNKTKSEKENETKDRIQKPNRHRPKTLQNPLQRAAVRGNKMRVKYLLNVGWSDYPAHISDVNAEQDDDIVKMLMIAKLIKGIRWRRAIRKISECYHSKDPTTSEDAGSVPKRQQGVVQKIPVWKVRAAYDKLNKNFSSSEPAATTAKAKKVPNLDLELHRYCEQRHYWRAVHLLEIVSSESLQKLLTHKDPKGMLPLHYAARSGSKSLVELLLQSFKWKTTAILSERDDQGRTPLHKAAENGDVDTIHSLLVAHPNRKDYVKLVDDSDEPKTACDLASMNGHADATKLLAETEHRTLTE